MHTRSVTKYFTHAFRQLFSREFFHIALSSLIVHSMMMMVVYFLSVFLIYRSAQVVISLDGSDILRFFIQGYIILFVMVIALLLTRGWQATIMPIRAIDHAKGFHFRGDIKLFHEHFGKYIAFFFWYSSILFVVWNVYIFLSLFLWAIHPNFGLISLIGGMIIIIRISTFYTLSWYHMLSEGGGSLELFLESKKYVRNRIVEVFLKILGFSVIVWFLSFAIELFLLGFLSDPLWSGALGKITHLLMDNTRNISENMKEILLTLSASYGQITITGIVISLIYSLSSVVTRAMFHIFSVHYYLHLRDEWEEEKK